MFIVTHRFTRDALRIHIAGISKRSARAQYPAETTAVQREVYVRSVEVVDVRQQIVAFWRLQADHLYSHSRQDSAPLNGRNLQGQLDDYQRIAYALEKADCWHILSSACSRLSTVPKSRSVGVGPLRSVIPDVCGVIVFDDAIETNQRFVHSAGWYLLQQTLLFIFELIDDTHDSIIEMYQMPVDSSPALRWIVPAKLMPDQLSSLMRITFMTLSYRKSHKRSTSYELNERGGSARQNAAPRGELPAVQVVYLHENEEESEYVSQDRAFPRYTHRWKVRQHERYVPSGGYYTWVREHYRGPGDAPLLDRPRVYVIS